MNKFDLGNWLFHLEKRFKIGVSGYRSTTIFML